MIIEEIGNNHWELFLETRVLKSWQSPLKIPKVEFIFSKVKFLSVKFRHS